LAGVGVSGVPRVVAVRPPGCGRYGCPLSSHPTAGGKPTHGRWTHPWGGGSSVDPARRGGWTALPRPSSIFDSQEPTHKPPGGPVGRTTLGDLREADEGAWTVFPLFEAEGGAPLGILPGAIGRHSSHLRASYSYIHSPHQLSSSHPSTVSLSTIIRRQSATHTQLIPDAQTVSRPHRFNCGLSELMTGVEK